MSFFDDASLAFLPSGGAGKDGKAYSIKPTDGTGDFTFSRGSNLTATRVGPTGLIEKGRENIFTYSNDFSNAAWTKSAATITANALTSPQGNNNASYLTDNTANNFHGLYAIKNITSVVTCSVFVKYDNKQFVSFLTNNNGASDRYAYFDLVNKTTHNISSGLIASIEDVGGGWLRLSVMSVSSANGYYWWNIAASNSTTAYVGDGTGRIGIFGAQLELGLAATDYIESGASTGKAGLLENEPRFDYSGGATCPSLLLEPQRVNILPYSEYFDTYTKLASTIITNATTSPEGVLNASKLIEDTSGSAHRFISTGFSTTSGNSYSGSIFLKKGERSYAYVRMNDSGGDLVSGTIDLENGSVSQLSSGNISIDNFANGWYKIKMTGTSTSTSAGYFEVRTSNSATYANYTGDGTSGVYIYGLQVEAGSYPTSYIPNHSGGSATRTGDECIGSVNANNFNSEEGVLYAEVSLNLLTPNMYIQISDGTYSNRVAIINNNSSSIWRVFYRVNGVSQIDASESGLNTFETNKIAISWKLNEFKLYVNGVKITQVNSGSVNAANTFNRLEFKDIVGNNFYGNAKQVIVFPTALSDADLETLTTL